jgi:GTP-binding protein Era
MAAENPRCAPFGLPSPWSVDQTPAVDSAEPDPRTEDRHRQRKPQTTRTRLLGIKTLPAAQLLLIDTPGIHDARDVLNRRMVDVAEEALLGADVVLWLVDATRGVEGFDPRILEMLTHGSRPCCVALNKVDLVAKPLLLPLMSRSNELLPGREIVPVSALTGDNIDCLLDVLAEHLPEGPRLYGEDEITDQSLRALAQSRA